MTDNRPGAGGNLGMELTARAAPDGYTFGVNTTAHAINMTLFRQLGFDAVKSFEPVALLTENPLVLVVHPASPAQDDPGPDRAREGQAGPAQRRDLGPRPVHASGGRALRLHGGHPPHDGTLPGQRARDRGRRRGHVDLMFDTTQSVLQHVNDGRVRALGITSAERQPIAPAIPTIAESGAARLRRDRLERARRPEGHAGRHRARLNAEIVKLMAVPDVAARFAALGATCARSRRRASPPTWRPRSRNGAPW